MLRNRHEHRALALAFALGLAAGPSAASAQQRHARKKTPSATHQNDEAQLRQTLHDIDASCFETERAALKDFNSEQRKASRTLESLDRLQATRNDALKAARKKLAKKLKQIHDDCSYRRDQALQSFELGPKRGTFPSRLPRKPAETVQEPEETSRGNEESLFSKIGLHGSLRQETAYRANAPHQFTKNRSLLFLQETIRVGDPLKLYFSGRGFFDTVAYHHNRMNKDLPGFQRDTLESETELHDAFLDYSHGDFDLRLGRQTIVWGDAVSLFVADVVNAKDLREYILPDFDFIRIPQWSADISYTNGSLNHEMLWSIPKFNKFATPGSEFAFPIPVPAGIPFTVADPAEPAKTPSNSEAGMRLSSVFGGLDIGAFYLYGWDQTPVFFRTIDQTGIHFTPAYRRQNYTGLTFSKDIFDLIAQGELVVKPNAYFPVQDTTDADGVVRRNSLEYVVGVTKTFSRYFDTNVQINQRFIRRDGAVLVNANAVQTHYTAWLKWKWFDDKIEPEYLIITDPSTRDRLHRPKLVVNFSDRIRLRLGVDIFEGHPNQGQFGIFTGHSRSYAEADYHF